MIDAVLDSPKLMTVNAPIIRNLLSNDLIQAVHDDLGVFMYHYDEIAAEMNIPIGTVKSRIFFARKKLKRMIQNQYGSAMLRRA